MASVILFGLMFVSILAFVAWLVIYTGNLWSLCALTLLILVTGFEIDFK